MEVQESALRSTFDKSSEEDTGTAAEIKKKLDERLDAEERSLTLTLTLKKKLDERLDAEERSELESKSELTLILTLIGGLNWRIRVNY